MSIAIQLPPSFLLPRSLLRPPNASSQRRHFGIRSIDPPRPDRFNIGPGLPPLLSSSTAALERRAKADTLPLRTGALAIKKGMTAMFDSVTGVRTPCTVLQLDRVQVVNHKTRKRHGYYAVCVGYGHRNERNISKSMLGHYSIQGVSPKQHQQEFRVRDHRDYSLRGKRSGRIGLLRDRLSIREVTVKGRGFKG
jgi:large subunit ribosomal protein L3